MEKGNIIRLVLVQVCAVLLIGIRISHHWTYNLQSQATHNSCTAITTSKYQSEKEDALSAELYPKNSIKKVGDTVQFKCRSPKHYTGSMSQSVQFVLKHDQVEIARADADEVIEDYSFMIFDMPVLSIYDAGEYTCTVIPSQDGAVVTAKTWLKVTEDTLGAYLFPKDQIKKVGDTVQFLCRSPPHYTGLEFCSIEFVLKHDKVEIFRSEANSIRDIYSVMRFDIRVLSLRDAGEYTCTVIPSGDGAVVTATTWLNVTTGSIARDACSAPLQASVDAAEDNTRQNDDAFSNKIYEDCVPGETYMRLCKTGTWNGISWLIARILATVMLTILVSSIYRYRYQNPNKRGQPSRQTCLISNNEEQTYFQRNILHMITACSKHEDEWEEGEEQKCIEEEVLLEVKPTPPLTKETIVPNQDNSPVNADRPLSVSNTDIVAPFDATSCFQDWQQCRECKNYEVKIHCEVILLSPDKPKTNEYSEKGVTATETDETTEIDWFKIFRYLAPTLPADEWSWKSFAFELLDVCQQRHGLPKDIHNEVKNIENNSSKDIRLAYLAVFELWHSIMADEASLDHIEQSLKILKNKIIMDEFLQIKSNPPKRIKRYPKQADLSDSLVPYKQTDRFIPHRSNLLAYAQHEHTYETRGTISQSRKRQIVQFTNIGEDSQTCLKEPMKLPLSKGGHKKEQRHRKMLLLRYGQTKVTKKVLKNKLKLKKKYKATKQKLKIEKMQHIETIKTLLLWDQIPLTRQVYNVFLDYIVKCIMKHNNVARKVVLSITHEAYEEIAKTKNSERYILYCGSPKLNLDRKQYECLQFYVKHARARVLRELGELGEQGDGIYLFLAFDGKSALEGYQRKKSSLKKTYNSNWCEMDSTSSSVVNSSSQSDVSEISDTNEGDPSGPSTSAEHFDQFSYSSKKNDSALEDEISDTSRVNSDTEKRMPSSCKHPSNNEIQGLKRKYEEDDNKNKESQQYVAMTLSYNEQIEASAEPGNNNITNTIQYKKCNQYTDMPLDDLLENIEKELESSAYV